ncbi:MAG: hypothetical protein EBX92_08080, partial [Actinobacteria bacterium]|nr:hypothetical protein [Actinomycetota bacterium]
RTVLQLLSASVQHTESGVVNVFRILVREDLGSIGEHAALYEKLLHSALSLKILLLCTTGAKPATNAMENVVVPDAIIGAGDRVRILVVEDNIGVYFGSDRGTPEALAIWPDDPDGARTMEILEDALVIPEVFSAVFEGTKEIPHRAFSVGTRQAWFGRFPTDAIADVFKEVGQTISGGDSFSALERRPPEWIAPHHLCGEYAEEDLLRDGEGLSVVYAKTRKSTTDAMRWFGLKSGFPLTKRIARFSAAQASAVADLSLQLRFVDQTVGALISGVEASDGFSDEEAAIIEGAGIRLYRDDDRRQALKDARTALLEDVIQKILRALSEEQSIAPYYARLDQTIERVEPKSSEEIQQEFQTKLLTPLTERLDNAAASAPRGLGMRIAKKFALLLAENWFRILLFGLGIIGLLGVLDHIFDDQTPDLLTRSQLLGPIRQELRLVSEVVFLSVVLSLVVAALLLFYADSEIRKWGRSLHLTEVNGHVDAHEAFIRSIALNDWILSKTRRAAIEPLRLLRDSVLQEVTRTLGEVLVDGSSRQPTNYDTHSFNPAVRKTFQAGAHIGIFKNLPQVKKVLSRDVVWIVRRPIESHAYSLLGSSAEAVGPRIVTEIRERLDRYVQSVFRYGVYSRNHLIDEHEGERERQKLIDQYWTNADSINDLLNGIVLAKESEPVVQFIQAESLSQLDASSETTVFVRFAPRTSKLDEVASSLDQREVLRDVIFTRSAEIGGVIRLIGYREGTVF